MLDGSRVIHVLHYVHIKNDLILNLNLTLIKLRVAIMHRFLETKATFWIVALKANGRPEALKFR